MKKKIVLEIDLWTFDREWEELEDWDGYLFLQERLVETEPNEEDVNKELPKFFMHLNDSGGCMINGVRMKILSAKIED